MAMGKGMGMWSGGMGASAVWTEDLTRRYGKTLALDRLSLRAERGEIFGLVGPDGAGKSTTIRLLTATISPSGGRAVVAGHDVARDPEGVRAAVGYVPQRFALYGDLTVAENLAFFADVFAVRRRDRERRAAQLLAFSRLAEHAGRLAEHLSGGMKRKLALACALIHRPEVLFLDEPTAGVDPLSRRELWRILGTLLAEGLTIVVSTAYMDEADRCHRLAFLAEGRLVAEGSPEGLRALVPGRVYEVRGHPLSAVRAGLAAAGGVERAHLMGDRVHAFAPPDFPAASVLPPLLARAGVEDAAIREVAPSMEDVFVALRQGSPSPPLVEARDGRAGEHTPPGGTR